MKPGKVRPIAICVFYHHGRILTSKGYDMVKDQTFYRPLGGKIEFGESGSDTVIREISEEIEQLTKNIRYLGSLQNIFTYNGEKGHEIVLVYDGEFEDQDLYECQVIYGKENDEPIKAFWKELIEFEQQIDALDKRKITPLYPTGLLRLLKETL